MLEKEGISGVFFDKEQQKVLLLRRTLKRTYSRGLWDPMGGEIQEGETPDAALIREAFSKLHIQHIKVLQTAIVRSEEVDAVMNRHVFICLGDYSELILDSTKYDTWKMSPRNEIVMNELTLHGQHVFRAVGVVKD